MFLRASAPPREHLKKTRNARMRSSINYFRSTVAILVTIVSQAIAAEPAWPWKLLPFRPVATKPAVESSGVAPASHQSPLPAPEPFPLPPGLRTPDDLMRQTDADALRKSWG